MYAARSPAHGQELVLPASVSADLPFAATHRYDLVPGTDESGQWLAADVPGRPNHHHTPHAGRSERGRFQATRVPLPRAKREAAPGSAAMLLALQHR
jgi:hypothetical protein